MPRCIVTVELATVQGVPVLLRYGFHWRGFPSGFQQLMPMLLLDYWIAGSARQHRDIATRSVAFPLKAHGRHPNCVFRSSIPGPSMPLSTLHLAPHGARRKTQVKMVRYSFLVVLWGFFLPCCTPVYPGACAPSRSRLGNVL